MALPVSVSDLNAFTKQHIEPKMTEVVFKKSPLYQRIIERGNIKVDGGTSIQAPLIYQKLNGGFYSKGESFNISYLQTEVALQVNWKFADVNVTLYREDNVLNRGRNAAFSLVEAKMANAAMTMAEIIAKALYADGQSSAADVVSSSGVLSTNKSLDGLLAWIDDGNNGSNSYHTATDVTKAFTSIAGLDRADLFNSAPSFGASTSTVAGASGGINAYTERAFSAFQLKTLNLAYGKATFGNEQPDLILTTQNAWNKFWNAIQPFQRYQETASGKIGFPGFRFNQAEVVVDQYMPEQLMLMLNTEYLQMFVSQDPLYQFGFTGFKEEQSSTKIAGQNLFSGNLMHLNPRTCAKVVGSALA